MITVFTPTYNRAHLLTRLYESLCQQTYKDFEWIIVDDGSTDQTAKLFGMSPQAPLRGGGQSDDHNSSSPFRGLGGLQAPGQGGIRYIRQANGGKHRAINRGVQEARGELFFIVDSDDLLTEDALQTVVERWAAVRDDVCIGGVCGLDMTPNGTVIGSGLAKGEQISNSLDIRLKYHVTGDLKEVFRTSVLREFPFPEYESEKFCPEALVWNRIAQQYNLLYFNLPIYIAEYQKGGLTDRIVRVRMESPMASTTCYQEMVSYDIPLKEKVKAAINYWRFAACLPNGAKAPRLAWYWRWCQPAGLLMHLRDSRL